MGVNQTGHQGLGALAVNDEGIVVGREIDLANLFDSFSLDKDVARIDISASRIKDVDVLEQDLALVTILVVVDGDVCWRGLVVRR